MPNKTSWWQYSCMRSVWKKIRQMLKPSTGWYRASWYLDLKRIICWTVWSSRRKTDGWRKCTGQVSKTSINHTSSQLCTMNNHENKPFSKPLSPNKISIFCVSKPKLIIKTIKFLLPTNFAWKPSKKIPSALISSLSMPHAYSILDIQAISTTVPTTSLKITPAIPLVGLLWEPTISTVKSMKWPESTSKKRSCLTEVSYTPGLVWHTPLLFRMSQIKQCQYIELLLDYFLDALRLTCIWEWNTSEPTILKQPPCP